MATPIKINKQTGNAIVWIFGGTCLIALASYVYSKIPKRAGVHGVQSYSQSQLQALAMRLHENIDGITVFVDYDAYQQAINLSDGDFIRLYNLYNEMFQNEDDETMTVAVAGEFSGGNYHFRVLQEAFLGRCAALDLP